MVLRRRLATIDLSTGSVEISTISTELRKNYLGGRGMNMYLLSRAYSSISDPFSPQNPLIFGAGLLTGTLSFGSRINITEMKCLDGEERIAKEEKRRFILNRERARRCPFKALPVLGETAYHCNLCGGKPRCIKVCTPGAITLLK